MRAFSPRLSCEIPSSQPLTTCPECTRNLKGRPVGFLVLGSIGPAHTRIIRHKRGKNVCHTEHSHKRKWAACSCWFVMWVCVRACVLMCADRTQTHKEATASRHIYRRKIPAITVVSTSAVAVAAAAAAGATQHRRQRQQRLQWPARVRLPHA